MSRIFNDHFHRIFLLRRRFLQRFFENFHRVFRDLFVHVCYLWRRHGKPKKTHAPNRLVPRTNMHISVTQWVQAHLPPYDLWLKYLPDADDDQIQNRKAYAPD
jgi:hypothetical protein